MDTVMQENILDGISMIVKDAVSNISTDKTIECEICKVQNAANGIYTVKYTENNFTAYSTNGIKYNVGDFVYVLVPQGDFNKNKIILCKIDAAPPLVESQDENYYNEISDNLLFNIDNNIELCTYNSEIKDINFNDDFISADIVNYQHFKLQADFKTDIIDLAQRVQGNYGLKISVPALDAETRQPIWVEKTIDIYNMNGNIYNFEDYSTQKIYFDFNGINYDPSRKIKLVAFVDGFRQDSSITDPDIFIKDISFKAVELLSDKDVQGYFLAIDSTESHYFLQGRYENDKILTPKLKINGVDADVRDYECYWFKEDSSIDIDSEYYNAQGGRGWRILNPRIESEVSEDGTILYDYNTSVYSFLVQETDVIAAARYKCVLVNSNLSLTKDITITNLNNNIKFSLTTSSGFTSFVKDVGTITLNAKLVYPGATEDISFDYIFHRFDKNGNYLDDNFYTIEKWDSIEGEGRLTQISFPVVNIEDFNTIKCEFIRNRIQDGTVYNESIGISNILLTTGNKLFDYYIGVQNNDVLYKYDANGNSPMVANFDGPYQSKVSEIKPLEIKIFKSEGDELSSSEYSSAEITWSFPKKSMLNLLDYDLENLDQDDDYYYVTGKNILSLKYNIKNVFNNEYNDNTVLVAAKFDNQEVRNQINIVFLKDGESGTNGSQYAAVITYNNFAYGEKDAEGLPQKLRLGYVVDRWVKYENNTFTPFETPTFGLSVFKNGSKIDPSNYTVRWSMFDPTATETTFNINNGVLSIDKDWSVDMTPVNIIQAEITIKESSDLTTGEEYIYAFYPLDIFRLNTDNLFVPDIANGFYSVTFDADGTNPRYNTNVPFQIKIIDGLENNYFKIDGWDSSKGLIDRSGGIENPHKYTPISQYIDGSSKNYIKAILSQADSEKAQINQRVTAAYQEKTDLQNEINYYQHEKAYLETFLSQYDYDDYIDELAQCENYLTYRARYLADLYDLLSIIRVIRGIDPNLDYLNEYNTINVIISNIYTANSKQDIGEYSEKLSAEGISNFDVINLISSFNEVVEDGIRKYNNFVDYNNFYDEISKYNIFVDQIRGLESQMDDLVSAHDERESNQEFINIQKQIKIYGNYLIDKDKRYYTKNNIIQNILKNIDKLLSIYKDTSFINKKYSNINKDLQAELRLVTLELSEAGQSYFDTAIVIKPILFLLNRYGLACLNGWDGNKLYTGNADEYLIAPQLGAGRKESDNSFTGLVMGVKKRSGSSDQIGLFGYNSGRQNIFLDAKDGSAIFGINGAGQIKLLPNGTSTIAGWNINKSSLSKTTGSSTVALYSADNSMNKAFEASDGSKRTYITYDGRFYTNNATVSGSITASDGSIGGWNVTSTYLYSNNFYINSSGFIRYNKTDIDDYDHLGFYIGKDGINIGDLWNYFVFNNSGINIESNDIATDSSGRTYTRSYFILNQGGLMIGGDRESGDEPQPEGELGPNILRLKERDGASFVCTTYLKDKRVYIYFYDGNGSSTPTMRLGPEIVLTNGNYKSYLQTSQITADRSDNYGNIQFASGSNAACVSWCNGKFATIEAVKECVTGHSNGTASGTYSSGTHVYVSALGTSSRKITSTRHTMDLSDRRLKENIVDLEDFSNVYMKLRPVKFNYKYKELPLSDNLTHYGIIAQELKQICDEENISLEHHSLWNLQDPAEGSNEENFVGKDGKVQIVDKEELHALHIQMIQKQQKEIEFLKQELEILKNKIK